jgi:hypothetical protein
MISIPHRPAQRGGALAVLDGHELHARKGREIDLRRRETDIGRACAHAHLEDAVG